MLLGPSISLLVNIVQLLLNPEYLLMKCSRIIVDIELYLIISHEGS